MEKGRFVSMVIIAFLLTMSAQAQYQKAYVKYFTTASWRNTEGDLIVKNNGVYYAAWTQFRSGTADNVQADIAAKYSLDSGRNWIDLGIIQPNIGVENTMSVSLVRIAGSTVHLYFCVKNGNTDMRVYRKVSTDDCASWGAPEEVLEDGGYLLSLNAVARKTSSGRLIIPVYFNFNVSIIPPYMPSYCYYSDNNGMAWGRSTPDLTHNASIGYAEPGFVELAPGNLLMYLRNETGFVHFSQSADDGATWGTPYQSTLSSTHSPAQIIKLSTGSLIAFHNPVLSGGHPRRCLRVSKSSDSGASWITVFDLENDLSGRNYSYPSVREYDGRLLLTYWELNPTAGKYALKFAGIPLTLL